MKYFFTGKAQDLVDMGFVIKHHHSNSYGKHFWQATRDTGFRYEDYDMNEEVYISSNDKLICFGIETGLLNLEDYIQDLIEKDLVKKEPIILCRKCGKKPLKNQDICWKCRKELRIECSSDYVSPPTELFELGWGLHSENDQIIVYKNSEKEISINKIDKSFKTNISIDLNLLEILVKYLKKV